MLLQRQVGRSVESLKASHFTCNLKLSIHIPLSHHIRTAPLCVDAYEIILVLSQPNKTALLRIFMQHGAHPIWTGSVNDVPSRLLHPASPGGIMHPLLVAATLDCEDAVRALFEDGLHLPEEGENAELHRARNERSREVERHALHASPSGVSGPLQRHARERRDVRNRSACDRAAA